jgi:serine protease Do
MKTFSVSIIILLIKVAVLVPSYGQEVTYANNEGLLQRFADLADSIYMHSVFLDAETTGIQLEERVDKKVKIGYTTTPPTIMKPSDIYQQARKATVLIGNAYKCNRCDLTHLNSATGFFIDKTGILVTNYHVLDMYANPTGGNVSRCFQVLTHDDKVYPMVEILATSKLNDLAIIRVDTGGEEVEVLSMGKPAKIGEKVYMLGHPQGFYYHFTDGMVANNYMGRAPGFPPEVLKYQMAITADYATGASGGAIINESGQVVGVVSTTRTLHVNVQQQQHAQMVVKQTIPVIALNELLTY